MSLNKNIYYLRYTLILGLLCLSAFSYHPLYSNVVIESDAVNPLSRYISLLAVITFAFHFSVKPIMQDRFIRLFAVSVVIAYAFGGILDVFGVTSSYIGEAKNILMALIFILIGYQSRLRRSHLSFLIVLYALVVSYCTYSQIMSNFGAFMIADQYMQYGKNTLGVMLASACVSLTMLALIAEKKIFKYTCWVVAAIVLFFTITIRARAAFLTVFALVAFCVLKNARGKNNQQKFAMVFVLFAIVLAALSFFTNIFDSIFNYIFSSFTQNQGTDLTSGRMSRNVFALQLLFKHPFFGNLECKLTYEWIHNYFLRILSSYGLIGALPLAYLYIKLALRDFVGIRKGVIGFSTIGYFVTAILLVISLEEPTFPYAPGTGVAFPLILFGLSLAESQKAYKNDY